MYLRKGLVIMFCFTFYLLCEYYVDIISRRACVNLHTIIISYQMQLFPSILQC